MISSNLSAIFYLISGVLFILALRGLSSPETSRQGNLFGILGMIIAITVTFLSIGNFSSGFIFVIIFLLVGGLIGAFIAYKIHWHLTLIGSSIHLYCNYSCLWIWLILYSHQRLKIQCLWNFHHFLHWYSMFQLWHLMEF